MGELEKIIAPKKMLRKNAIAVFSQSWLYLHDYQTIDHK